MMVSESDPSACSLSWWILLGQGALLIHFASWQHRLLKSSTSPSGRLAAWPLFHTSAASSAVRASVPCTSIGRWAVSCSAYQTFTSRSGIQQSRGLSPLLVLRSSGRTVEALPVALGCRHSIWDSMLAKFVTNHLFLGLLPSSNWSLGSLLASSWECCVQFDWRCDERMEQLRQSKPSRLHSPRLPPRWTLSWRAARSWASLVSYLRLSKPSDCSSQPAVHHQLSCLTWLPISSIVSLFMTVFCHKKLRNWLRESPIIVCHCFIDCQLAKMI